MNLGLNEIIQIAKVNDGNFFIKALFQRCFGSHAPDFPNHYVAFYRFDDQRYVPVGYVNFMFYEEVYLVGGMCIDAMFLRKIPKHHRLCMKRSGGIAQALLEFGFEDTSSAPAQFGYVGDKQAERVDLRVGFVHTGYKYLIVHWNRDLSEREKQDWIEKIRAVGPF